MINYNPKDWISSVFRIHKSDTFRKLFPMMLGLAAYAGAVAYFELEYLQLSENSHLKNLTLMHGMLGFVISLLLVFRTNTAYDRWWEGRKHWGALTNISRNFAIKLNQYLKEPSEKEHFKMMIINYAIALKNHLRENEDYHELDPVLDISPDRHTPNQVAAAMYRQLQRLYESGALSGEQLIVLDKEAAAFTDICGACERIKNTPIPYSHSTFLKKFIFLFVVTLPLGWVFSLGYYVVPVVIFVMYAFASLELIAEEIENPFGTDANDLPIDSICQNIRKHVGEILA